MQSRRRAGAWKDVDMGNVGPEGEGGTGQPGAKVSLKRGGKPFAPSKHLPDFSLPFHLAGGTEESMDDPSSERSSLTTHLKRPACPCLSSTCSS